MLRSQLLILTTCVLFSAACSPKPEPVPHLMSVQGKIAAAELGQTLIHEHLTTDFIGAEKIRQPQIRQDSAVAVILPHLQALKARGVSTLVACTPNYIGRDVRLLKALSELSGLNIITNTGYYAAVDKKYLPRHAFEEDAAAISARWQKEWEEGIEGSGIRPGFVKLGVGSGPLDSIEEKLLLAGIMLSKKSGLPIYVHTGDGAAAQSEYEIISREGLPADRLIWVHAQNGTDEERIALAQKGVWISLDGVNEKRIDDYLAMIKAMKSNGLLHRLLLSHDDGWSVQNHAGKISLQPFGNGNSRPYRTIFELLIPQLLATGFSQEEMDLLLVENPMAALRIK